MPFPRSTFHGFQIGFKLCKGVYFEDLGESFQMSLSMSLLLNLLFERDSYSNGDLVAKFRHSRERVPESLPRVRTDLGQT